MYHCVRVSRSRRGTLHSCIAAVSRLVARRSSLVARLNRRMPPSPLPPPPLQTKHTKHTTCQDTYRTLAAADNALMMLDGAKGLEPQTRKLFEVCDAT